MDRSYGIYYHGGILKNSLFQFILERALRG